MAKKSASSKGYRKQTGKKPFLTRKEIIILCVILAVVLAGFILLLNYDDGALKLVDGKLVTDGDNWLIVNGTYGRSNARYFKVGEAGAIEGYARATQPSPNSALTPEYLYQPEAEDGGDVTISVGTYPAVTAKRLADYYAETLAAVTVMKNDVSEVQTAESSGISYLWFSVESQTEPAEGETTEEAAEETADPPETSCARMIRACIDAPHSSAITVVVSSAGATLDDCLSADALQAELAKAMAAIKLEGK